jgi:alpha-tubulin suppressor-like RCC1 family protein
VISIKAGSYHSLALTNNGELYSWGENDVGQCGFNSNLNITLPMPVIYGISAIGVGDYHSFAITNEGTVLGWGTNTLGQLGIGSNNNVFSSPVEIKGISNVKSITGGYLHTIILKNDGTVWVCGGNYYGELGDGHIYNVDPNYKSTFTQLNGISGVKSIAGGFKFTIALLDDGSVWGCGINDHGQLGE